MYKMKFLLFCIVISFPFCSFQNSSTSKLPEEYSKITITNNNGESLVIEKNEALQTVTQLFNLENNYHRKLIINYNTNDTLVDSSGSFIKFTERTPRYERIKVINNDLESINYRDSFNKYHIMVNTVEGDTVFFSTEITKKIKSGSLIERTFFDKNGWTASPRNYDEAFPIPPMVQRIRFSENGELISDSIFLKVKKKEVQYLTYSIKSTAESSYEQISLLSPYIPILQLDKDPKKGNIHFRVFNLVQHTDLTNEQVTKYMDIEQTENEKVITHALEEYANLVDYKPSMVLSKNMNLMVLGNHSEFISPPKLNGLRNGDMELLSLRLGYIDFQFFSTDKYLKWNEKNARQMIYKLFQSGDKRYFFDHKNGLLLQLEKDTFIEDYRLLKGIIIEPKEYGLKEYRDMVEGTNYKVSKEKYNKGINAEYVLNNNEFVFRVLGENKSILKEVKQSNSLRLRFYSDSTNYGKDSFIKVSFRREVYPFSLRTSNERYSSAPFFGRVEYKTQNTIEYNRNVFFHDLKLNYNRIAYDSLDYSIYRSLHYPLIKYGINGFQTQLIESKTRYGSSEIDLIRKGEVTFIQEKLGMNALELEFYKGVISEIRFIENGNKTILVKWKKEDQLLTLTNRFPDYPKSIAADGLNNIYLANSQLFNTPEIRFFLSGPLNCTILK